MVHDSKHYLMLLILFFYAIVGNSQPNPQFSLIPANFGINNPNAVYATNIRYDDIDVEKQVFHLFLPDTLNHYPLVVYIHGGGFTGGNPGVVFNNPDRMEDIKFFLENGFAYASFGYRLINSVQPDTEGVIKSLNDSKRALQFVRYFADELHIQPAKIALMGTSAGSGTSLWLGTRSDMADPNATDPILQQSTRVCGVVASGSQATYDIYKWETQIYHDFDGLGTNFTLDSMANLLTFDRLSSFYGGMDSLYQMVHDSALIQYRQDVDMLFHMSSDDPPIYINSRSRAVHPSDDLFHHSFHGRALNTVALAAGIPEVKALIPTLSINTTEGESINEFLVRHLNSCVLTTGIDQKKEPENNTVVIFPNPANKNFSIKLLNKEIHRVEIYAPSGKLIHQQQNIHTDTISISVPSLKAGLYLVRLTSSEGYTTSRKLIIK